MKGTYVVNAIQRLEQIKKESKDYIVPNDSLSMKYNEYTGKYILEAETPNGFKEFIPSKIAFSQICEKMGIPRTYVRHCQENERNSLLVTNINSWLSQPSNYMLRTRNTKLRAFLSDRFRLIDNYDVAMLFLETRKRLQKQGIEINIKDIKLSETNLYIKSTSPQLTSKIITDKDDPESGDIINGGIIISNSDIGKGRFSIKNYIEVLRCTNGMIGEHEFSRVHIGKKLDEGEIKWSDNTHQLKSATFWSQAKDMITSAYTKQVFNQWVEKINGEASLTIERPIKAVDNVVRDFGINKEHRDDLLSEFSQHGYNKWSLSNAVTQVAQTKENYDDQIEMERIGTRIMTTPLSKIDKEE